MGIFDRITNGVEQRNIEALYRAELDKLEARIRQCRDQIVSLAAKADPEHAGLLDETKLILSRLEAQKRELEHERLTAPARKAVAEGRIAIDEQSSGVGDSATARGLTAVRDQVQSLNERANPGLLDENGVPIRGRQAALDVKAREARARDELARLKAAMGKAEDDDQ